MHIGRLTITRLAVFACAVLFAAAFTGVNAQRRTPAQAAPNYDVATEVTLTGTVSAVNRIPGRGQQAGMHLMLKTDKETVEVDLGPESFLAREKYTFSAGDTIVVTGSRIKKGDRDAVIARQVTRGDTVMTFRDAKGFPRWSGRGRF